MRFLFFFTVLLTFFMPNLYAEEPEQKLTREEEPTSRTRFITGFRGGFLTRAADDEITDHWEHETFQSYIFGISFHVKIPPSWKQFYFFAGPDFRYGRSLEELGDAAIESKMAQLFATGGLAWEPPALGGNIGFRFHTSFVLWNEFSSELKAQGYTVKADDEVNDDKYKLFDIDMLIGIGAYYKLTPDWWAFITTEGGFTGSAVLVGVNYGIRL